MSKKIIMSLVFIMVVALAFGSLTFADEGTSVLPVLKLSVEPSPLDICLPSTMYVAQLSFMPQITSTRLVADFYNINPDSSSTTASLEYLGSIPFDNTGRAALIKIWKAGYNGYFVAIAKTVIDGRVIWSNKVEYKIP